MNAGRAGRRGWAMPLRLARREALRHRGRSLLVVLMIALPVLGVTAADVLLRTADVNSVESLDRRLGAATARIVAEPFAGEVLQGPDPDRLMTWTGAEVETLVTAAQVSDLLDGGRLVPYRTGVATVATERGTVTADTYEIDLRDPVAAGLARVSSGRLPDGPGEVVINAELAGRGYGVGDRLDLTDDALGDPEIVGIAESSVARSIPTAMGAMGTLVLEAPGQARRWLVDGGPVTWSQVRELNALGAAVLSRDVVLDPPPVPPQVEAMIGSADDTMVAVVVLIVVMALIEVVLLAGPAFAVGARQQSRSLALMAAAGGTPAQARRVVLAGALVLGGAASAAGVVLGIGLARVLVPLAQGQSASWFGPFEVPWLHVLGIAAFGLASAVGAALVPAWIASRQDVVAVLAGRRGDRQASRRSPVVGLVLLALGVGGSALGVAVSGNGEVLIAFSAILAVLGMILLVPMLLVALARLSRRLPLVLRYAVRDAARHRTRTVPAVAAVAATVAGVVALGIATTSDEAQARAEYQPSLEPGTATLQWYDQDPDWAAAERLLARELPGATLSPVVGLGSHAAEDGGGYTSLMLRPVDGGGLLNSWASPLGSDVLVADELPAGLLHVPDGLRSEAEAVLAAGGVLAFSDLGVSGEQQLRIRANRYDDAGKQLGEATRVEAPALVLPVPERYVGTRAVLGAAAAERLDLSPVQVGLSVSDHVITGEQEERIRESLGGLTENGYVAVERGYQQPDELVVIQLVLAGLGAVLMVGGTLTATFLALSDARPDLATLSAVGAAPRTRRGVAAAYASVVGLVGALLGAVVGFIPGVAITFPLTVTPADWAVSTGIGASGLTASGESTGPYLDVPWLLVLGLVVALPLLTAAVVGLTARSRLPLVARLD